MRRLSFNVTADSVTPNRVDIGNAGEHNVTHLEFALSNDISEKTEYYRLAIGDFRSKKLYAEEDTVVYTLPCAALQAGTVLIQLEGYRSEENEVIAVFKSGIITANVAASVCPTQDIPQRLKDGVEGAVAELEELVEKGEKLTTEIREKVAVAEQSAAIATEQAELAKDEVNNAKDQVALATVYASEAGLKSQEAWQHAREAAASADAAANSALDSLNFSELSLESKKEAVGAAAEAKHNLGEAQKILESVQRLEESAARSKEEAGIHAMAASSAKSDAKSYAEEAEASANHAYGYLDEARQNVEKMYTIIDEELPIYSAIYKNDSPDWVEHETGTTYPPNPGKDVHFKADFKAGETYLLRFGLEHREGCFFDIGPCIVNPNTFDTTDVIGSYKTSYSDGVYEYEFVATRSAAEDEELLLFVDVPFYKDEYGLNSVDETAVYGKVEIYHKDNLHNVVNEQNELIASISNDIESALDGIIAIQENLIGGDTQ